MVQLKERNVIRKLFFKTCSSDKISQYPERHLHHAENAHPCEQSQNSSESREFIKETQSLAPDCDRDSVCGQSECDLSSERQILL